MLILCTAAHFNILIRSRYDYPATNSVARREITSQPALAMSEDTLFSEVIFKSLMQLECLCAAWIRNTTPPVMDIQHSNSSDIPHSNISPKIWDHAI